MFWKRKKLKGRPLYVAIVGIDGSGKTELAKRLHNRFKSEFETILVTFPRMKLISKKITSGKINRFVDHLEKMERSGHEHRKRERVAIAWGLMASLYPLEVLVNWEKEIVFYDRYPYIELIVYSRHYKGIKILKLLLSGILAQPRIIIKTDCPVDTALERTKAHIGGHRPEIHENPDELEILDKRYNNVLQKLANKGKTIIKIDTESELERKASEELRRDILNYRILKAKIEECKELKKERTEECKKLKAEIKKYKEIEEGLANSMETVCNTAFKKLKETAEVKKKLQ